MNHLVEPEFIDWEECTELAKSIDNGNITFVLKYNYYLDDIHSMSAGLLIVIKLPKKTKVQRIPFGSV